jgi:hypothetical protein
MIFEVQAVSLGSAAEAPCPAAVVVSLENMQARSIAALLPRAPDIELVEMDRD